MGFADLHIHTTYSWDGTFTVGALLRSVLEIDGLRLIAVTDHDEIAGALEAEEKAAEYGVEVVPGCEISSADGHVLALFIRKLIPKGLSLEETVIRVGEQGGLCIAAHPVAKASFALQEEPIRRALQDPDVARVLVGIETFNAGLVDRSSNAAAQALADTLPLAQVGGSDAHLLWMIGQSATFFEGHTAADLRKALLQRKTMPVVGKLSSSARIIGGWLSHHLLRRAGWVTGNSGPDSPLVLSRS